MSRRNQTREKDDIENEVQCLVCGTVVDDMDAAVQHLDDAHRLVTNTIEDHTRAVLGGHTADEYEQRRTP